MMDATIANQKLNEFIERGKEKSARVINGLIHEANARKNHIVPRNKLVFGASPSGINLSVLETEIETPLEFTKWSYGQVLENLSHINTPVQLRTVVDGLLDDGQADIATGLLNNLRYRIGSQQENGKSQRRLLRVVDNQIRGWLTPTYRILDQKGLVSTFASAVSRSQALVVSGTLTEVRYSLEAILPHVIEPYPGEFVVPAVRIQSSDYGWGALDLAVFLYRLVCTNGMMGQTILRKIHSGGNGYQGNYNDVLQLSEQTIDLLQAVSLSEMTDAICQMFTNRFIESEVDSYRQSAMRVINPENEAKQLRKQGLLLESEAQTAITLMNTHAVDILPETENPNSALRWGNVLAFLANQNEANGEKLIELQRAAGNYVLPQKGK